MEVLGLSAQIGSFRLDNVTFSIPERGYGVVIGPAGSGKTTLLETIGGIIPATGGVVRLDGRDVTRLAPELRGVGLVYQNAFLFPHLSVEENITYGASDPADAREVAHRLGADVLATRSVRGLSGGECQLVALARAIARRPDVLLLDEPFSALDPRRRSHVRREVRALHRERGTTVLQVTHDFTEAGLLGDVAVLLDAGRVLQAGPPEEVFRRPASPYIAEFLGAENVFAGQVTMTAASLDEVDDADDDGDQVEHPHDGRLAANYRALEFRSTDGGLSLVAVGDAEPGPGYAVIRAEEIALSRTSAPSSARNTYRGRVSEIVTSGALTRVTVDIAGTPLVAALTTRSARELALVPGCDVYASFKAMAVHLC